MQTILGDPVYLAEYWLDVDKTDPCASARAHYRYRKYVLVEEGLNLFLKLIFCGRFTGRSKTFT